MSSFESRSLLMGLRDIHGTAGGVPVLTLLVIGGGDDLATFIGSVFEPKRDISSALTASKVP